MHIFVADYRLSPNRTVLNHFPCTVQVFGFFEELLSTRFPHSSYKLVFVDQTYQDTSSYSTLTICK